MPPSKVKKPLTDQEKDLIKRWIESGAEWTDHWSFVNPEKPELPEANSKKHPVDQFIAERLKQEKIKPSPEADRRTLIRRITFDLTGLPPTPEDVRAFIEDKSPNAYEKVVDRLLASPHFGERMALMWLDAARYGDTSVMHADGPRDMWPWRDWVVNAYNNNQPYDQFSIEQLAGDLLPDPTNDQLRLQDSIATTLAPTKAGLLQKNSGSATSPTESKPLPMSGLVFPWSACNATTTSMTRYPKKSTTSSMLTSTTRLTPACKPAAGTRCRLLKS